MKFTKMHGCGNDYIYVNGFEEHIAQEKKPELVKKLSDRHFGIGGDGVIFINPSEQADFEMEMYNADGSRAEMCGNGIRCVANKEEKISAQGAKKAASFVKLCDAFGVGILTFTDVTGYAANLEQEKELAQAVGAMTGAFVQASVPKVNVITKKAFGSAYVSMNSKAVGADLVYAWEDAAVD